MDYKENHSQRTERWSSRAHHLRQFFMGNGPEFVGKALDCWAYVRKVKLEPIEPGKPVQNAFIESFNGKLREGESGSEYFFITEA